MENKTVKKVFALIITIALCITLFSFGVRYFKTAIGILFVLFKYLCPCSLKSSKELNFKIL